MNDAATAKPGLGTLAIHAGQEPDPTTGAVMVPIYATSTYVQRSPGDHKGFEYSRSHNPTRFAYERCVAALESGTQGYAFASGLAATSTVLDVLDTGSHVICMDDVYGGTFRLFERVRKRSAGLEFSFVDLGDRAALEAAVRPNTKLIWAETPTNPMLNGTGPDPRPMPPTSCVSRYRINAMASKLDVFDLNSPIEKLLPMVSASHGAIVVDLQSFMGLITQIDLVNFPSRRVQ